MKSKRRILLGISSGIAAYKVLELIPLLQQHNYEVVVMMTAHAKEMINSEEFERISGHPVYSELYPPEFDYKNILKHRHVDHIDLADSSDLLIIVPATANIIGKIANGIADDFVTTTTLAATCPVLVFPSMNVHMWANQAVQTNLKTLRGYGYIIVDPTEGSLACGYEGKGRLPEIEAIAGEILAAIEKQDLLKGKRILVTAGGTEEKIDEVRFIANRSSGKMGVAIADLCSQYGARVTLLASHSAVEPRFPMLKKLFRSSAELSEMVRHEVTTADIVFHVAAVSDFSVQATTGKLSSKVPHTLTLISQPKILDLLKTWNPSCLVIGFKAEYGLAETELIKKAKTRLLDSGADAIIANDISRPDRGFQSDENEVVFVSKHSVKKIPLSAKITVAQKILGNLFESSLLK